MSGGQTGVDRGALDAALDHGVRCGGWCPQGRLAEDGVIPERYPLTPLPGAGYRERTRRNVRDSDGTVILAFGAPAGGTRATLEDCVRLRRPHLVLDATELDSDAAARRTLDFAIHLDRGRLNVAGPRASQAPGARDYAYRTLACLFRLLAASANTAAPAVARAPRSRAPHNRAPAPAAHCQSCAAPLGASGAAGPAARYCRQCTDSSGRLRKKKEVRRNIARWMRSWQPDLDESQARERARHYMRAMPAWAD